MRGALSLMRGAINQGRLRDSHISSVDRDDRHTRGDLKLLAVVQRRDRSGHLGRICHRAEAERLGNLTGPLPASGHATAALPCGA